MSRRLPFPLTTRTGQTHADRGLAHGGLVWWLASFAVLLCLLLLTEVAQAQAPAPITVDVFANSAMHITPGEAERQELSFRVSVYRLDAMRNVEQLLNQQLPQTEEEAMAWMTAHEEEIRHQYEPAIKNTAQGMTLAFYYKLQRLPAMVINQRTVVYGVTDIEQAVAMAQEHEGEPQ